MKVKRLLSHRLLFLLLAGIVSMPSWGRALYKATDSLSIRLGDDRFISAVQADPATDSAKATAQKAFGTLDQNNSYTDYINPNDLTELPIGIHQNISNVDYAIVVTKAKFTPDYALINVYARLTVPQQNASGEKQMLYFGAENVKLSYSGKIVGDAQLSLLGDINIPFNNDQWMLTLQGGSINTATGNSTNNNTYVTIDCDGVKELSLTGNIQISRNVLIPLDAATGDTLPATATINNVATTNRVRGDFSIKATDWNDILVGVTLTPFAIAPQARNSDKGYFSFFVNNAILDLSDLRTDPSVVFPQYYYDNGYLIDGTQSWRGLYVQSLHIGLPQEFKTTANASAPISFDAQNLLIDNYGVSGSFSANNVFPLDKGVTATDGGWHYSLDKIEVDLAASHITGADLEGKIQLPVQKQDAVNYLAYKGTITDDQYLISVTTLNDINFDLWQAKATIASGSTVELNVQNHRFLPKAILNGKLQISANNGSDTSSSGNKIVNFKDINFQGLTLQTQAPYLSITSCGVTGEQGLANFPASISNINLTANGQQADLSFGLAVGLQDKGFAASGTLHIKAGMVTENGGQSWQFQGVGISALALNNVDIGVATVNGSLAIMQNDPLYGNGFKASLTADVKSLCKVTVNAAFGYSTYRYWGFEGTVNNLSIQAGGGIQITGFTGGAFYHMLPDPATTAKAKDAALVFTPDSTMGVALRAGVYGNYESDKIASFMAEFNINTNSGGGIANIGFLGEATIMADFSSFFPSPMLKLQDKFRQIVGKSDFLTNIKAPDKLGSVLDTSQITDYPPSSELNNAPIRGTLAMNYDFNNNIFHANLDVYINVANGIIRGVGNNNEAGWAVLHIAPDSWYLYIGTPQNMIGLRMGLKNFFVQAQSYLMVGSVLPASPPPPAEVAQILGIDLNNIDYMKELNAISSGGGFAFGAHFKFDTGDMTALFLYAHFAAGFGGDVMLRNYGDASCSNLGGKQIGINGWYANGQAYVYLQGELGIQIKLFFVKKKIPIIKAGAAALLQMKGPNPFWMLGYLGGNYNLLGGLVKGSFRFKLEIGDNCQLENGSVLGGMKIITDVTPQNNDTAVDVFAIPQATFAFKVNQPITIPQDDGDHTYKIMVDSFSVKDETGANIKGQINYASGGDIANFVSNEILPPNKKLTATVQVSFLEKVNGIYQPVTDSGKKAIETEQRQFTTGTAPSVIPLTNIQYAYPVVNQENYYIKESNTGYIRLKRGQNYLFDDPKWKTVTQLSDAAGNVLPANFNYDANGNEISFAVPALNPQTSYTLSVVAKPANNADTAHQAVVTTTTNSGNTGDTASSSVTMQTTTKAAANVSKDGSIERLSFAFRTSQYNTFADKMKALSFTPLWLKISSEVVSLQNNMNATEYFDATEISGSQYTDNQPLIRLTAAMSDAFAGKFKDLFYTGYPIDGILLDRAADSTVAIPPTNALPVFTSYSLYLNDDKGNPFLKQTFPYQYDLFRYYKSDWYELVSKAAMKYVNVPASARPQVINNLIGSSFGVIPYASYEVKLQYVLPGNKQGTQTNMNYEYK